MARLRLNKCSHNDRKGCNVLCFIENGELDHVLSDSNCFDLFILKHLNGCKCKNLPPSPPALPILGHLHLLNKAPHRAIQALSSKYGPIIPIMYLHFGCRPVLIVSSPSAAEECFSKNDIIFASKILGYNYTTLGFSPHGDHWRNLRRLATVHVFSSARLPDIRGEEIRFTVGKLFQSCDDHKAWRMVNLRSLFFELVYNVAMVIVAGKRGPMMDDLFGPGEILDICDYIPFLRWLGFRGMEKKMTSVHNRRDSLLQGLIDEGRKKIAGISSVGEKKTFIEALLETQQAEPDYYTDEIRKGLILPMFTAGTHTAAFTMEWVMTLLLNHPNELHKARMEIDNNVTHGKMLEDSDIQKLPYLRCVINETLRLYPVGPLLVPHYSSKVCKVGGFGIPEGTTLLVNAWAIHRDPDLWEEPGMFKPDRFKGFEGGYDGFRFVPFGMGRRACPGYGMAMRLMGLAIGTLIKCFDWEREGPELVNADESAGMTSSKQKPLEALCRPRISMVSVLS